MSSSMLELEADKHALTLRLKELQKLMEAQALQNREDMAKKDQEIVFLKECPSKDNASDKEVGQGARGSNVLTDVDEEAVDDVEAFSQECQNGEDGGMLVEAPRRESEEEL